MTQTQSNTRPAATAPAVRTEEALVVAQLTGTLDKNGKSQVHTLGPAYRNKPGRREGFTVRAKRFPTSTTLHVYRKDGTPFPASDAQTLAVYAVIGRMPSYARSSHEWQSFGKAELRPDRLAYVVTFDAFPPVDDEQHLVFSLLRRQVGDTDHPDTVAASDGFFAALESDMAKVARS